VIACSAGGDPKPSTNGVGGAGGSGAEGSGGTAAVGATVGIGGGPIIEVPDSGMMMNPDCDSILEVTYRDFDETHPDFEMGFKGDVVRIQLIEPTLGPDRKPVFKDSVGCPADDMDPLTCDNWQTTGVVINSAETFDQWYRTSDVNREFERTLELVEDPAGSGQYVFDSATFFPLGPDEGFGITPANHHLGRNFLFTTEIHVNFTYRPGQVFTFRGDDDLWIFVNGTIAMDLGSMHAAALGTIDFDAQAERLGILPGGTYAMDIFHAERHTSDSNFRFQTNIACFVPGAPE
jgi:fibro-slime domain-containing protein